MERLMRASVTTRLAAVFAVLSLLFVLAPATAMAAPINGTIDQCDWIIDDEGKLIISVTAGKEGNIDNSTRVDMPWKSNADKIKAAVVKPGVKGDKSLAGLFKNLKSLKTVDIDNLNTEGVVDFSGMFEGDSSLESIDVSSLDTTSVKNMSCMFFNCISLESANFARRDLGKVEDMSSMFKNCYGLIDASFAGTKLTKVKSMKEMFYTCSELKTINFSGVEAPKDVNMNSVFMRCRALESVDFSGSTQFKANDLYYAFKECETLTSVDLSAFDASDCASITGMFEGCKALVYADFTYMNADAILNANYTFDGCAALKTVNLTGLNTSKATHVNKMFNGCSSITWVKVSKEFRFKGSDDSSPSLLPNQKWLSLTTGDSVTSTEIATTFKGEDDIYFVPESTPVTSFADVNSKTPHEEDIMWLAKTGISTGWKQGKKHYFKGMDTIVRQDMAAFLHRLGRLCGLSEDVGTGIISFADVDDGTPHVEDIKWLAKAGISTGWKEGSKYYFRGMDTVVRQDMAAFMHRLANLVNTGDVNKSAGNGTVKLTFADVDSKTPHAEDIKWMASWGVSTGWKEGDKYYFKGMDTVVRQDTAAFMHRLMTTRAIVW